MKLLPLLQQRRWPLLAASAMLIAVVAYWLWPEPGADTPLAVSSETPAAAVIETDSANVAAGVARPLAAGEADSPAAQSENPPPAAIDIFAVQTWEPPPPPVDTSAPPPPPPKPEAPPLPFRYLGQLAEPGKATVFFLAQGEKTLAVSSGDLINGKYLVGKLQGGQLNFLYRPMKIQQSLSIGGES